MQKSFVYSCALALGLLVCGARHAAAQFPDPQLPQVFLDTTYPAQTGATITVSNGGSLQTAIDAASPGDTVSIQAGATFTGSFVLPPKANPDGKWIVIRSSSSAFNTGGAIPPGTRADGSNAAHTSQMAILRSPGGNQSVIRTAAGANLYRLVGLDVGSGPAETNLQNPVINLGSDSATSAAQQASDVVVDRCFVHGADSGNYRRGIAVNGVRLSVIDSTVANFHYSQDAQAIAAWNGAGPFKIVNNYLESTGETILFGGDNAAIANLVASDIEVRRNLMTRPVAWRGLANHVVKNAFELKNARRVLVDGNILENIWHDGQVGYAVLFTPRGQGGTMPWATVDNVTFTNNIVRHVAGGFQFLGHDDGGPSQQARDILIRNNLFDDVNATTWGDSGALRFALILHSPANLKFEHNTIVQYGNAAVYFTDFGETVQGFVFKDNILRRNTYGIWGAGQGAADEGNNTLTNYTPGAVFAENSIAGASASKYPAGTHVPDQATWEAQFENYNGGNGGNYRLRSGNIYEQQGNGDIGADIDAIYCAIDPSSCGGNPGGQVIFSDDFEDGTLAAAWVPNNLFSGATNTSIPIAESGGRLSIGPVDPNQTGYNGVRTNNLGFNGAFVQVQLVQAPDPAGTAFAMLTIGNAANHYRFWVSAGELNCERKINNVKTQNLCSLSYNAANHQFLRIRHDGTNAIWETGPSGSGPWQVQYQEAWNTTALPLAGIMFELKAGQSVVQSIPAGTVQFDNFLIATPPPPETALLDDNFDGASLDPSKWTISVFTGGDDPTIPVTQTNGQLRIGPLKQNTAGSHYNAVTSTGGYAFTGAYAYAQAVTLPAANTVSYSMLSVALDNQNHYRIFASQGQVFFEKKIANVKSQPGAAIAADASTAFWRIRHDATTDQIVFETAPSAGGVPGAWTVRATTPREFVLTSVRFELKAGTSDAQTNAPGTVAFDNFRAAVPQ